MNVPLRAPGVIGTWGSRRATRCGFESYNQAAASLAWDRTLAFLRRSSTL